ncbi:LPXTG cell wall anchor domain-containing protein [Enterococcus faecalis]|uniref:LPXTG cell wall anchor domain-containing protein n=1 Tax=Enterococcus faecalis TaxID=1351 RepID=UPI0013876257|nr:LPXTG cell wall anchor domain-containing protein [Enterococcus faecalis]MDT2130284.1 LPXTG cell wall anchor domain-containing protein [Enterococcus faecalis]
MVEKASVVPKLPKTGEKENMLLSLLEAGSLQDWHGLESNEKKQKNAVLSFFIRTVVI